MVWFYTCLLCLASLPQHQVYRFLPVAEGAGLQGLLYPSTTDTWQKQQEHSFSQIGRLEVQGQALGGWPPSEGRDTRISSRALSSACRWLPSSWVFTLSSHPGVDMSLSEFPLCIRTSSCWLRAHPYDFHLCEDPVSKYGHTLKYGG